MSKHRAISSRTTAVAIAVAATAALAVPLPAAHAAYAGKRGPIVFQRQLNPKDDGSTQLFTLSPGPDGSGSSPTSTAARSIPPIPQAADKSLSTVGSSPARTRPSQLGSTAPIQLGFRLPALASASVSTNPTGRVVVSTSPSGARLARSLKTALPPRSSWQPLGCLERATE